jgi:6-pyruvoyltetrahydropterin/6-carboxytetrahydropterin synthase
MYEIRVKTDFSAAHNLKEYQGKCERLHGHNWTVEAVFACDSVGKDGIAIDFRKARRIAGAVTEKLDHIYLNKLRQLKKANPTSENLAAYIYREIKKKEARLKSVTVWENERASALYSED